MPSKQSPWPSEEEREKARFEKREAVLQAAVKSFNENGFHVTSLDNVATSLNVTKPTIYHYFANKDEILFECVRRGLEAIHRAAQNVEQQGGSGLERLRALMRDYAIIMSKDFGMCVIRTADYELAAESLARFRGLKREIDLTVRRVIEAGMSDGSIAKGDPRLVTFAATGALNWIAHWYKPGEGLSAELVADGIVNVLVAGIASRPSAMPKRRSKSGGGLTNRK